MHLTLSLVKCPFYGQNANDYTASGAGSCVCTVPLSRAQSELQGRYATESSFVYTITFLHTLGPNS